MDMDMDHGMGTSMFQTTNMAFARMYWYLVAGAVGGFLVAQIINYYQTQSRFVEVPHLRSPIYPSDLASKVTNLRLGLQRTSHEAHGPFPANLGNIDRRRPRD